MLERAGVAVGIRGGSGRVAAAAGCLIDPPSSHGWADVLDLIYLLDT